MSNPDRENLANPGRKNIPRIFLFYQHAANVEEHIYQQQKAKVAIHICQYINLGDYIGKIGNFVREWVLQTNFQKIPIFPKYFLNISKKYSQNREVCRRCCKNVIDFGR